MGFQLAGVAVIRTTSIQDKVLFVQVQILHTNISPQDTPRKPAGMATIKFCIRQTDRQIDVVSLPGGRSVYACDDQNDYRSIEKLPVHDWCVGLLNQRSVDT